MPTDPERVIILDTTLRDGELAPGCGMTQPEKLRVARALGELGVDVIEAGYPAAARADWESVAAVAREVHGPVICALARCRREEIEQAAAALQAAARRRLHVYIGTSPHYRDHKLQLTAAAVIATAVAGVSRARELCADVEFSPEDASRTELEFLAEVIERVIDAGATTINIPDTAGHTVPDEFSELFRYLRKNVRGIDKVVLSVHCHDDLGMAVANSLTAVVGGSAPDRMHHQWYRRTRWQLFPGRSRDGVAHALSVLRSGHHHPRHPPVSGLAPGIQHHRRAHSAQQGGRGRERGTQRRCRSAA